MSEKLIATFLKVRNGILRGDLYNCLINLENYTDDLFVCDDNSFDGTTEVLRDLVPEDQLLIVPPEQHSFAREMFHKEDLLQMIHKKGPYSYIFWIDSDEVLDKAGTEGLRDFCEKNLKTSTAGWMFHYTQFWRNTNYARTDDGFDDGHFVKLWRYRGDLSFDVGEGTHRPQFPKQLLIARAKDPDAIQLAPFELLHYGNVGQNLKFKALQYAAGPDGIELGGVARHLQFTDEATYRKVEQDIIPNGSIKVTDENVPTPFTEKQINLTLMMRNFKKLERHFCVIVSAYNRAKDLPRALDSLIAQTYEKWHCVVVDDGSTDNTEQVVSEYCNQDPRFFYAKYLKHGGGVLANERGMDIAVNTADYWTRLGSDDWFMPTKLEIDAEAFNRGHLAVYSPFVVHRNGSFDEIGNKPVPSNMIKEGFTKGGFFASWASMAVHCHILRELKKKYGNYVDPQLVNMEDLLFNYRVSTLTPWIFNMLYTGEIIVNPDMPFIQDVAENKIDLEVSGVWNCVTTGASGNTDLYNRDHQLSLRLIQEEQRKYENK